jgi:hypothetical protein
MSVIKDSDGNDWTWYPVHGIVEGTELDPVSAFIATPIAGSILVSNGDPRVIVKARLAGTSDPYQNLATDPIDLAILPSGVTEFDVVVEAVDGSGVEGLERVPINVIAGTMEPADWLA